MKRRRGARYCACNTMVVDGEGEDGEEADEEDVEDEKAEAYEHECFAERFKFPVENFKSPVARVSFVTEVAHFHNIVVPDSAGLDREIRANGGSAPADSHWNVANYATKVHRAGTDERRMRAGSSVASSFCGAASVEGRFVRHAPYDGKEEIRKTEAPDRGQREPTAGAWNTSSGMWNGSGRVCHVIVAVPHGAIFPFRQGPFLTHLDVAREALPAVPRKYRFCV